MFLQIIFRYRKIQCLRINLQKLSLLRLKQNVTVDSKAIYNEHERIETESLLSKIMTGSLNDVVQLLSNTGSTRAKQKAGIKRFTNKDNKEARATKILKISK